MRARQLLGWLFSRWRTAPETQQDRAGYDAKLTELIALACDIGARDERGRIASIMNLPAAARFPRFALTLALSGASVEHADQTLAVAESDSRTHLQAAEFSSEGMTLQ